MYVQVENVFRIFKLEKKEFDIIKEFIVIYDVIEDVIEYVNLIFEDKYGIIVKYLNVVRIICLINEVYFINVLVNILENVIKYLLDVFEIEVFMENIKDMIFVKIKDNGLGMSKVV